MQRTWKPSCMAMISSAGAPSPYAGSNYGTYKRRMVAFQLCAHLITPRAARSAKLKNFSTGIPQPIWYKTGTKFGTKLRGTFV